MEGFTTTVQLPDELTNAIKAAVQDSFDEAKQELTNGASYPLYMNKTQVCKFLNISYNTLQNWLETNPDFPHSTINGVMRFNRDDVTEYMRRQK